jgi:ABC-2 type transport system ATP-binding protein
MSTTPAIELTALSKRYGSTPAVDDLHWSGGRGVIGLLGPNGAGKSTLLRMLATVLSQDRGAIRIFGLDPAVADDRLAIRRRLGYLPQEAGLYRNFTAFDLVDYVAVLKEITDRSLRREEVRRVLDDVGLADDMHRRIRTLSGGMQRRVALAAALLGRPDLLVLDEPSAGLDPDQRLRLRTVLSEVGRRGTVLLSTHHTDEVAAFCQRVLVLDRGRLLFDGAPRDLASRAAGRVWISDRPDAGALRSWVTGDGDVRNIGEPPAGALMVDPTLDDGYLLVASEEAARA